MRDGGGPTQSGRSGGGSGGKNSGSEYVQIAGKTIFDDGLDMGSARKAFTRILV